ncbi:hypothetical protein LTR10_016205 [Elasticomyces elasticus]|uniref:AB hydrolase-1 domain-containing protein n=1 Tax=Exophiala sideris TaxID=1016849 RepID=A0ABR0JN94_9EURO|nr:hypothetical protein LTR10_016205 [Elasticomyces elasticus]KAK5037963.1 hypothetical protein LTS07_001430 [Exophiala sideris]KAK5043946.1 hypothetical protein LTR13_000300 [Exophiala sideris]KAK5067445.1 hypothetical protein LTR69_001432 [Exophiala sideris]KAK5182778.1 hypothetical protein LTR44_005169 [Eurotiomycetes sp. CCFEE 6388]
MAEFPRKTFTVASTGHTYDYIRVEATSPIKSTIVFFHGFPAIAFGWRHQIKYFADHDYGVIAPDLLGYGGTSKPESVSDYCMPVLVEDIMGIIDHERIDRFHGVGHDTGSALLSRLYNYHPARLLSLTSISTPYNPPASHFDLEAVNKLTKGMIGFEKFAYIRFLASDRSPQLIEQHIASFQSLTYHRDVDVQADNFYPPGRCEAWLTADRNDNQTLLDSEDSAAWLRAFRDGGFHGPTNWYRAMTENLSEEGEKADIAAGKLAIKIDVPVMAIDSKPDKASLPGFLEGAMAPHAPRLTVKVVQSQGHYPHIVSKEEVNQSLHDLISEVDS